MYLHNQQFSEKPTAEEIKILSKSILNCLVDIDLETFALEHTELGRTALLCEYLYPKLSKNTPIKSQSVIMLDFDNNTDVIFSLEDLEEDDFINKYAVFYYQTFSSLKDTDPERFRVVFALDKPLTTEKEVEDMYNFLFEKYPFSDTKVGQTSRMFFGSTLSYTEICFQNRLPKDLIYLNNPEENKNCKKHKKEKTTKNSDLIKKPEKYIPQSHEKPIFELLKNRDYLTVKKRLNGLHSVVLADEASALRFLKTLDMREILELPSGNPFNDVFDNDENPSASIYITSSNTQLYKRFNKGKEAPKDIIGVFSALTGETWFRSIQLLIDIIGGTIDANSEVAVIKRKTESFISLISSSDFKTVAPNLHFWLGRYIPEITALLNTMLLYFRQDDKGQIKYINYLGLNSLKKEMETRLGYPVTEHKLKNVINVLATIDGIWKLSDDSIPKNLLHVKKAKQNDPNMNRPNIYELKEYPDDVLTNMEEIALELQKNNVTVRGLSFEMLYRVFDEDKAKQVFPQNKMAFSKDEIKLTKKSMAMETLAIQYIEKELKRKQYVFEQSIIRYLQKEGFSDAEYKYKQMLGDICSKYGYTRSRFTKSIKNSLGIFDVKSNKTVIFRY